MMGGGTPTVVLSAWFNLGCADASMSPPPLRKQWRGWLFATVKYYGSKLGKQYW